MNNFLWQEDYKIGNHLIDLQHQHLFDLANRLFVADSREKMIVCFIELFRYIREHFQIEETFMKDSNYSGYLDHVRNHDLILAKFVEIGKKLHEPHWQQDMRNFISDWLLEHILKADMSINLA